jgi:hypothetical protein
MHADSCKAAALASDQRLNSFGLTALMLLQVIGQFINHSTQSGFRLPPICSLNGRELRSIVASLALPDFQSRAVGVAHFITAVASAV